MANETTFHSQFRNWLSDQGGWWWIKYLGEHYPGDLVRWPRGKMRDWVTNCPGTRIVQKGGEEAIALDGVVPTSAASAQEPMTLKRARVQEQRTQEDTLETEDALETALCRYLKERNFHLNQREARTRYISLVELLQDVSEFASMAHEDVISFLDELDYVKVQSFVSADDSFLVEVVQLHERCRELFESPGVSSKLRRTTPSEPSERNVYLARRPRLQPAIKQPVPKLGGRPK